MELVIAEPERLGQNTFLKHQRQLTDLMIIKKELENILRCPVTHAKLSFLTDVELTALFEKMRSPDFAESAALYVTSTISTALKAQDHERYYPVIDDIFYLLPHLAIKAADLKLPTQHSEQTKQAIKQFYDEIGWQQAAGVYQDAQDSEDLRAVASDYIEKCHQRLQQHLPSKGQYLLDVACGPLQYPAYLRYSTPFEYRICADISVKALQEAKKKLGEKGLYLLCDVTKLPLQANKIDGIVSLHTLYHVPANEQALAFAELHRVLAPQGTSVIVYSWGHHSLLMNSLLFPFKAFSWLKRKLSAQSGAPALYFHAYPYRWFVKEIQSKYRTKLFAWRSVNVPFLKTYIHSCLAGKAILQAVFWFENRFPQWMGRFGAYPLLVSKKESVCE